MFWVSKKPEKIALEYAKYLTEKNICGPDDIVKYTREFLISNHYNCQLKIRVVASMVEDRERGNNNLSNSLRNSYVIRNSGLFDYNGVVKKL